jgi:hypothetical protein
MLYFHTPVHSLRSDGIAWQLPKLYQDAILKILRKERITSEKDLSSFNKGQFLQGLVLV